MQTSAYNIHVKRMRTTRRNRIITSKSLCRVPLEEHTQNNKSKYTHKKYNYTHPYEYTYTYIYKL